MQRQESIGKIPWGVNGDITSGSMQDDPGGRATPRAQIARMSQFLWCVNPVDGLGMTLLSVNAKWSWEECERQSGEWQITDRVSLRNPTLVGASSSR